MKKFVFRKPCMKDSIPKASGRTVQWFRYSNLAAQPVPSTEGSVGTPSALTSKVVSATVSQYTSFINLSDLLVDTGIDSNVANAAELLGYQAGLTVDTLTRTIFDNEYSSCSLSTLGTYFRVADLRNARHQLQALDVQPLEDGEFAVYMHPFVSFDLVNDPAAGGLADIFKYNTGVKDTPLVKYEDRGTVTHIAGCRVEETTNVKTVSSTYGVYVFGKGAVACVDLEGRGPSNVTDPAKQSFKINTIKGAPSIVDPEGVIGAACSYNFVFTTAVLEGPTGIGGSYRMKQFRASSSIG
jgi:N4-gp56 family major capsid protein